MTSRKDANRRKLYETAIRLFSECGYHAVSMSDIAEAAGFSRASVFNHFPSKQDFLLRFFVEATARIETGVRARPAEDFSGFLSTLCAELGKSAAENETLFREISILSVPGEQMRDAEIEMDASLAGLITAEVEKAQARGEISAAHDPAIICDLYMATLTGTAREWALSAADDDLETTMNRFFQLIFSGLRT